MEMQCKHNQIHILHILHTYTFTNMNPAASGTMSMSYLKRHVYELRTSMDAEGVCVDNHQ